MHDDVRGIHRYDYAGLVCLMMFAASPAPHVRGRDGPRDGGLVHGGLAFWLCASVRVPCLDGVTGLCAEGSLCASGVVCRGSLQAR